MGRLSLPVCAVLFISALFMVGCGDLATESNNHQGSESAANDYSSDLSEKSNELGPNQEEWCFAVVGQRSDADIVLPMTIQGATIDNTLAFEETEVPMDGTSLVVEGAEDSWLEARIVHFPVYEDMMTYDDLNFDSTYYPNNSAIDLKEYSQVELTKEYLSELAYRRKSHWESGIENYTNSLERTIDDGVEKEGWSVSEIRDSIALFQLRVERLDQVILQIAEVSEDDTSAILSLYAEVGRANTLLKE